MEVFAASGTSQEVAGDLDLLFGCATSPTTSTLCNALVEGVGVAWSFSLANPAYQLFSFFQ